MPCGVGQTGIARIARDLAQSGFTPGKEVNNFLAQGAPLRGALWGCSATADLTTCPPWARVLEVAASRRFQADKTSQVAKIEVGVGTNFKPQES